MSDARAFHTPHTWRQEFHENPDARKHNPLLDNPSNPHPYLTAVLDLALLRLYIALGNGGTSQWGPDAGMRKRTATEWSPPAGEDVRLIVEQLAWDYHYGATTHRARLRVILDAQRRCRAVTHTDRSRVRGTEEWRRALADDARPYSVLTRVYRVSRRDVARIKREAREMVVA